MGGGGGGLVWVSRPGRPKIWACTSHFGDEMSSGIVLLFLQASALRVSGRMACVEGEGQG